MHILVDVCDPRKNKNFIRRYVLVANNSSKILQLWIVWEFFER